MPEQTCTYGHCQKPAALSIAGLHLLSWRCPEHTTLTEGWRLVRESDVRQALADAAMAGHQWFLTAENGDEVTGKKLRRIFAGLTGGQEGGVA